MKTISRLEQHMNGLGVSEFNLIPLVFKSPLLVTMKTESLIFYLLVANQPQLYWTKLDVGSTITLDH